MFNHGIIEKSTPLMLLLILLSLWIGGIVQIIPLFKVESTI